MRGRALPGRWRNPLHEVLFSEEVPKKAAIPEKATQVLAVRAVYPGMRRSPSEVAV
jgi:hypothetical protein